MRPTTVLLPLPLSPTSATVWPAGIVSEKFLQANNSERQHQQQR